MVFIREKKIDCGNYREVDIIPRTDIAERAVKGKRAKRKNVSAPKQMDLNDKYAKRYFVELGNGNFIRNDLHVTLTYDNENMPGTIEESEKMVRRYLRKVAYRRMKMGLSPLKYILVTEYDTDEEGNIIKRFHHHVIMNGGLSRDVLEAMWTNKRINWKKIDDMDYLNSIPRLGYVNADRLQLNENGIEALCKYMLKSPRGKKRFSSSRNLIRPVLLPPADHKYSKRKVENLAKAADAGKKYFEKQFKNYDITSIEPVYYEETGWHIYLKMWKKRK